MTSNTPPDSTRFLACPLCGSLVDPDKGTKDPRWANVVHEKCVRTVDAWPSSGGNPLGRSGTADYHDR